MDEDLSADLTEDEAQVPGFRILIEFSLPPTHRFDPSNYDELILRWKDLVKTHTQAIWESWTMSYVDSFDEWRVKGEPGIRIFDPSNER